MEGFINLEVSLMLAESKGRFNLENQCVVTIKVA